MNTTVLHQFTETEQNILGQLNELGFVLTKVTQRRVNDFLYFESESGSGLQIPRNQLTQEYVDRILTEPKKKSTSKKKKRKSQPKTNSKKVLTNEQNRSSLEGETLKPGEAASIDKAYIETHWS